MAMSTASPGALRRPRYTATAAASDAAHTTQAHGHHGPRLEDFGLVHVIGSGGSATVLRAYPLAEPRRVVALKALDKRRLSRRAQRYLMREIAVHRSVSPHPHIVSLHDAFENRDGVYLVLELLRGGDLYALLRRERRPLSPRAALTVLAQVTDALTYLHGLGVSHRDLKLENIMFARTPTRRGDSLDPRSFQVKLVDFGLACLREPSAPYANRLSREPCGTKNYCAPEVLRARETPYLPEAADMWSVGVVLFAMLTRRLPFVASPHFQGADQQAQTATAAPASHKIDFNAPDLRRLPRPIIAFVRTLLCANPQERPSAKEAGSQIAKLLVDESVLRADPDHGAGAHSGRGGSTAQSGRSSRPAPSDSGRDRRRVKLTHNDGACCPRDGVQARPASPEFLGPASNAAAGTCMPRAAGDEESYGTNDDTLNHAAATNAALDTISSDVSGMDKASPRGLVGGSALIGAGDSVDIGRDVRQLAELETGNDDMPDASAQEESGSSRRSSDESNEGDGAGSARAEGSEEQESTRPGPPFNLGFFRGIFEVFNRTNSGSSAGPSRPGSPAPARMPTPSGPVFPEISGDGMEPSSGNAGSAMSAGSGAEGPKGQASQNDSDVSTPLFPGRQSLQNSPRRDYTPISPSRLSMSAPCTPVASPLPALYRARPAAPPRTTPVSSARDDSQAEVVRPPL